MAFRDYSLTPASNTTLADGTYVGPNMLRNKVRPAIQQLMADGKEMDGNLRQVISDTYANVDTIEGVVTVVSRASLALIGGMAAGDAVVLTEAGYEGLFIWRLGDFTSNVISDPSEEFYIVSDLIPVTTGAWVRAMRDFQPVPLAVPPGFDWIPPVFVYRSSAGVYTTNFDAELWKVPATASLYVATTGNDTTGNGTAGNPWATPYKALTEAGLLGDTGVNIFVAAGIYHSAFAPLVYSGKNINLIATGGRVLITSVIPRAGWTLDGAGTYKHTLGGFNSIGGVRDWAFPVTWPNGEQTPQLLTLAASKAACQATVSTYWTDNVDIWVHLQDGRVPDAASGEDVGVMHPLTYGITVTGTDSIHYVEGFDFEGGDFLAQSASGAVSIERVVVNNCTQRFSLTNYPGFAFIGVELIVANNCRAFDVGTDAFGYTPWTGSAFNPKAVEIDCHAYQGGRSGTTNNGSTNHGSGRTVRVNSVYRDTLGPLCADVGAAQSWNINVDAQDSLMTSNDAQDACFVAGAPGDTVKMWLDDCTTGGSFYDFYVGTGCFIRYRNMALPASVGGSGTVTTY